LFNFKVFAICLTEAYGFNFLKASTFLCSVFLKKYLGSGNLAFEGGSFNTFDGVGSGNFTRFGTLYGL
jgi:hypothetical protein